MLSYRHGFHAGNFADILKHYCLFQVLNYFNQKDKPYLYLDTHGGAGLYDLQDVYAEKNKEFASGYSRLLEAKNLSPQLLEFRDFLINNTPDHFLYPGSPWIAAKLLRSADTLQTCELHSSDYPILQRNINSIRKRRSFVFQENGYQRLLSQLPPVQRRAVVLIDPSYEDKTEYQTVIKTIKKALKVFSSGCYLIWYPLVQRDEVYQFLENIQQLGAENTLDVQLILDKHHQGLGMYGCGMYIINPPYILKEQFEDIAAEMIELLGKGSNSRFVIKS